MRGMPDRFIGQKLGDYICEERIGRGASAVVYRAFQTSLQRYVALKVMDVEVALRDDTSFQRRFAQEAEMIASLEHLHILPVYDCDIEEGGFAYIATRLLRGGSLADLLQQGPLTEDRAARILYQIASGLSYAHSKGVIHRDLKPSNILLDGSGNVFLTDFGLAKVMGRSEHLTQPGSLIGTPAYVAPEGLRGEPLDQRADIYSLGVVAYQMITGRLPFETSTGNLLSLIRKHLEEDPIPPRAINPDIPATVEAVILRALHKDPRERFQSAEAFSAAFHEALGLHATGSYPRIAIPAVSANAARGRQRRWMYMGIAAVVLTLTLLIVLLSRSRNMTLPPPNPTVLTGAVGTLADSIPTTGEISLAQAVLGQNGFIAHIACTLNNEFHAARAREMGDVAARYGLAYRVYDSEADTYQEITQIERARLDGARAIILCPLTSEALTPQLNSLRENRIPVVFLTSFEPGYGVVIDSNNYEIGLTQGRFAGEIIRDEMNGDANVLILLFPGFPASEERARGMTAGLQEIAPNVNVLAWGLGFTRAQSRQTVSSLLRAETDIDLILSLNDAGAFGAIDALVETGHSPDSVPIVSSSAETLAVEYVRDGYFLRGTVYVNRQESGLLALNAAVRMLASATLPEKLLFQPGEMVTRESLLGETTATPS